MVIVHVPVTTVEAAAQEFITKMRQYGGQHVRRFEAAVGPLLWKIDHLRGVSWRLSFSRQVRFRYSGTEYKARFSHKGGGRLEIVALESDARSDGPVVVAVHNLDEVMQLDLAATLLAKAA